MRGRGVQEGDTFDGRYEVISKLGEGGFGTVYKARQSSTGQLVALKTMRTDGCDAEQIERRVARLLLETRLCAQLRHPHIVPIVDAGQAADGAPYVVFAYVPGEDLAGVLAGEGALAPREAKHLMLQVLDGIACAHAHGVVHRDLKPSNILIVATGARRNAVILDFGIGGVFQGSSASSPRLAASQEALGTPGYAAPEQTRGAEPSPAADIFSWGLVFLECLTGASAFEVASPADMTYRLLGPEPVPIPRGIADYPLGALLRRATEKHVSARAEDAAELLRALEACEVPAASRPSWALGAKVDDAAPQSERASSVRERAAERRHLVALCCQWRVRGDATDTEASDGLLRAASATAMAVVRDHGGYVVSALGDRLLVYFGYPSADEDDARRAARAALAIVGAARAEGGAGAGGAGAPEATVEARLGVHSGLVLMPDIPERACAEASGDVGVALGETPRVAAHLCASAPWGVVAVSAESRRWLRGRFELAPVASPPDAPALHGVHALGPELGDVAPRPMRQGAAHRVVGRDHEIDLLVERWGRARVGSRHACLILGEAGIGKSRLVREVRDRAAGEAHHFLEVRCSQDTQHNALFPVIDALTRSLGLDRAAEAPARVRALERLLEAYGVAPADTMPLLLPLFSLSFTEAYPALDVSSAKQRSLTLQALASLFVAMAASRPLLLVVEDLHWADATTLDLMALLRHEIPSAPMCVLMTARPEHTPPFSTNGLLQLHLERLVPKDVHAMIAGLLGDKALPGGVVDHVVSRADGVPLFVEEMTRMMLESGWLLERADRYELSDDASILEVPSTLRALLTARLDRLGRAKETAQVASALGRKFRIDVVSAVCPLGAAAVEEDVERLMAAGLVRRQRDGKELVGVFKHALVRDAAYDGLSRQARVRVHARIAAALEERFPDVVRARPDLLAHHHAAAEQKIEASRYAQLAARQGLQRSAYDVAIAHASNVVAWSSAFDGDERVHVELAANDVLTQAMMASRGWADTQVKRTAQRSSELLRRLDGHRTEEVPVLWSLFAYYHTASRRAEARAVAEELVAVAEESGDRGLQAAAYVILAITLRPEGRILDAARAAERAIGLYDPALHRDHGARFGLDSLVLAKTLLAQLRWFTGETHDAFALIRSGIEWARDVGHVPSIAIGLLYASHVHQYAGDKATTAAMTREILMLASKYGLPAHEGYASIMHAWAVGDEAKADPILQRLAGMECKLGLTYYASLAADTMAERGRYDAAVARIDYCLTLCDANGERYYEPELHRLRAEYEHRKQSGDCRSIRASLETAARLAREHGMSRTEALSRSQNVVFVD